MGAYRASGALTAAAAALAIVLSAIAAHSQPTARRCNLGNVEPCPDGNPGVRCFGNPCDLETCAGNTTAACAPFVCRVGTVYQGREIGGPCTATFYDPDTCDLVWCGGKEQGQAVSAAGRPPPAPGGESSASPISRPFAARPPPPAADGPGAAAPDPSAPDSAPEPADAAPAPDDAAPAPEPESGAPEPDTVVLSAPEPASEPDEAAPAPEPESGAPQPDAGDSAAPEPAAAAPDATAPAPQSATRALGVAGSCAAAAAMAASVAALL